MCRFFWAEIPGKKAEIPGKRAEIPGQIHHDSKMKTWSGMFFLEMVMFILKWVNLKKMVRNQTKICPGKKFVTNEYPGMNIQQYDMYIIYNMCVICTYDLVINGNDWTYRIAPPNATIHHNSPEQDVNRLAPAWAASHSQTYSDDACHPSHPTFLSQTPYRWSRKKCNLGVPEIEDLSWVKCAIK